MKKMIELYLQLQLRRRQLHHSGSRQQIQLRRSIDHHLSFGMQLLLKMHRDLMQLASDQYQKLMFRYGFQPHPSTLLASGYID